MRHLIIAALLVAGSLLAVQATVMAFEQAAAVERETRVSDVSRPAPAMQVEKVSLRLAPRAQSRSRSELRLPSRLPTVAAALSLPRPSTY